MVFFRCFSHESHEIISCVFHENHGITSDVSPLGTISSAFLSWMHFLCYSRGNHEIISGVSLMEFMN